MVLWTVGGRKQIKAEQMPRVEQARVLADKVKEAVKGSLEKENQTRLSWHKRSQFWLKPFCDLSDHSACCWAGLSN